MASTLFIPGTVVRSIWLNEVDKATHNALTAVAGTNTLTATGPLTSVAYVTGDRFFFVPAITNTGATTININGLGAKNLTKYGVSALVAGDLVAGTAAEIYYDGIQFQLLNPQIVDVAHGGTGATTGSQALINLGATGRLIGVQTFLASGTYTPTSGTTRILVKGIGAGGAGGGSVAPIAGQVSVGSGGAAGGVGETFITSGFLPSVSVTIGAGGSGVLGAAGGAGGVTTFGALLTLNGGNGGTTGAASTVSFTAGATGGSASGGNIVNLPGENTEVTFGSFVQSYVIGGLGASSIFGGGGFGAGNAGSPATQNGGNATGRGAGGGGSSGSGATTASTGGAGTGGIIIVYEYS